MSRFSTPQKCFVIGEISEEELKTSFISQKYIFYISVLFRFRIENIFQTALTCSYDRFFKKPKMQSPVLLTLRRELELPSSRELQLPDENVRDQTMSSTSYGDWQEE